jgi:hypothetical protein
MNYSKAHHYFRTKCHTEDVFSSPEKYLGQNYAIILDFWWYLETMTREQLQYADAKYHSYNTRNSENRYRIIRSRAYGEIGEARVNMAIETTRLISREILEDFCYVATPVTAELIALQTIFDNGEELIYLPMLSF